MNHHFKKALTGIAAVLLLVGVAACGAPASSAPESSASSPVSSSQVSDSASSKESNTVNLPQSLYVETSETSAAGIRHDFSVSEPMTFTLKVNTEKGSLKISVLNSGDKTYTLEPVDCTSGDYETSFTIEQAGNYSVQLALDNHSGHYEIAGLKQ